MAAIPLPLATDFFTRRYLDAYWTKTAGFPDFWTSALGTLLQQHFGLRRDGKRTSRPNIEEVYSFLNRVLGPYSGSRGLYGLDDVRRARDELLKFIRRAVYYPIYRQPPTALHASIAANVGSGDSIITFNWDLLVDHALDTTVVGIGLQNSQWSLLTPPFAADSGQSIRELAYQRLHQGWLLKMHGAVNLAVCTNSECPNTHIPFRFDEFDAEDMEAWPCLTCGSQIEPFIVPPDVHKTYRARRFLQLQASIAAHKIQVASQLVFIGYSFPVFDFEAAVMFRLARLEWAERSHSEMFLSKVTIVNPEVQDRTYVARIKDLLGLKHSVDSYGHHVDLELFKCVSDFLAKGN